MSPKFKDIDGYVFRIFSNEEDRMHIHIEKADKNAKYWLEPNVELAGNYGFSKKELKFIEKILETDGNIFKHKYALHTGKRRND